VASNLVHKHILNKYFWNEFIVKIHFYFPAEDSLVYHRVIEQCCHKFNKDIKNGPHQKRKNLKKKKMVRANGETKAETESLDF